MKQIVIDTNVLYAGLRSRQGWSFKLLSLVSSGRFEINLSVPLVMEYEGVLFRQIDDLPVSRRVVEDVIDFHCKVARRHKIFFLWRPHLPDPDDELVLELAVKARCHFIVTYNKSDFVGVEAFGIQAVEPGEFLQQIGGTG